MKKSTLLAVALVWSSVASGSQAFALGGGQIVLSADRLFGLTFSSTTTEPTGGGKVTDSRTDLALFWPPLSASPYEIPRLGFDYIVPGGLTVGGSLGFMSGTGKTKSESPQGISVERDDASITTLAFAPRVGYALQLAPGISFWPRGGITYYSMKIETTGTGMTPTSSKTTTSGLGFNIEPMFVFSPVEHFGFVAGPVIDIPLSGNRSSEQSPPSPIATPDTKYKYMNYGITVGLLGSF